MARLTRREAIAVAGAALLVPEASAARRAPALLRSGDFREGVLSGDPRPRGITLLTRVHGAEGPGGVTLELARDPDFRRVVTRSRLKTNGALGHAVKAQVSGLHPRTQYWYRFAIRGADSAVGRFRTALPPDSREVFRFGIFAGQEYTNGYFNAHDLLADEDVDFVLNLGNYICADQAFRPPDGVRELSLQKAAGTLGEYRRRYRDYRRDPALRRMHATHAMVSSWDDREVAGRYAGAAAGASEYSAVARAVAYRAWFESMPHYPKAKGSARVDYRRRYGRLLELFVLDTRQYRTEPGQDASILGRRQREAVTRGMVASGATWKVLATPSPVTDVTDADGSLYDSDGWQHYRAEREDLLAVLPFQGVEGAVFASAGLRRFAAVDLTDGAGHQIAPELLCGSVSQRTEGEATDLVAANPGFREADPRHGYAVCVVRPQELEMQFRKLTTVRSESSKLAPRELLSRPARPASSGLIRLLVEIVRVLASGLERGFDWPDGIRSALNLRRLRTRQSGSRACR